MEQALGNIILTLVVAVVALAVYIWIRFFRNKKGAEKHGEDGHADAPKAPAKKDDHGHGHMSWGQSFLFFSFGVLVIAVGGFGFLYGFNALLGQNSSQGTNHAGAYRPVAHSSRIPASACSVPPADAELVTAPVGACSDAYPVPSHSYGCADPDPSSGLVRVKSWYEGNPEPSNWDSGVSRGNKRCFGAVGSTPVTIHVWTEPQAEP